MREELPYTLLLSNDTAMVTVSNTGNKRFRFGATTIMVQFFLNEGFYLSADIYCQLGLFTA